MMERTFNVHDIKNVTSHPSVAIVEAQLEGSMDPDEFIADTRNIVFANEHGFIGYHYAAPQTYIGHYAFIAGHRGRKALVDCQLTLDAMFGIYDALSIWACVPLQIKASALLLRWLGFKYVYTIEDHAYYALKGF